MFSITCLIGNLGQDPVIRQTPGGKTVCDLSLAVKRFGRENPVWVKVVAWEKVAERCRDFKKGDRLLVRAELDDNVWVDRDGKNRTDLFFNAGLILSLSPRREPAAPANTGESEQPEQDPFGRNPLDNVPF
jgi:single-strand DNA-binding protein